MLRTAESRTVINSLERFFAMYPDAEPWLKENFSYDNTHWDEFQNLQRIIEQFLQQKEGEFFTLVNNNNQEIMIIEIGEISYCITGEVAGPDCNIVFGTQDELERYYLTYARKNYNSDLSSYQDAKMWVKENWNSDTGIVIF